MELEGVARAPVTLEGLSSSYFFSRNSLKCFATASAIEIVHPEQAEVPLTGSGLVAFASLDSPASTREFPVAAALYTEIMGSKEVVQS